MRISRGEKRESSFLAVRLNFQPKVRWHAVPRRNIRKADARPSLIDAERANKIIAGFIKHTAFSTVPGVITRMMSRLTSPLASAGSSICSQMATLYPLQPGEQRNFRNCGTEFRT